jgi:uncharacterized protein (TIGR03435 family)
MRTLVMAMGGLVIGASAMMSAQAPHGQAFEVASIKPNKSTSQPIGLVGGQPGGVTFKNLVLRDLIRRAYRLQEYQVLGGPSWISSERFDVLAKANGNPSVNEKWAMVRALLAERFKLKAHTESRSLPIFRLLVVRKDGRLGPRLTHSSKPCVEGQILPCAVMGISRSGELSARVDTIDDFRRRGLMFILGVTVIDQTGLQGNFDIDLKWTPESPALPFADRAASDSADDRPSIFTALREQLGLKLEPSKGPVQVLVIDSVEHPTEN